MLGGFSHFDQAPVLDVSGYLTCPSHVLWFAEHQLAECRTCLGRRLLEDYVEKFSSVQSPHKSMFWSAKIPLKKYSNGYTNDNLWFKVTYIILHDL